MGRCPGDYLEISDGSSSQRYCGTSTPAPLTTTNTITVKLHVVWGYGAGFLATACCSVAVTTDISTGECSYDEVLGSGLYLSLPGSSPTCIKQSAPDGYFRNEDCWRMNLFVCEVDKNVSFTQPPEGTIILSRVQHQ